MLYADENPILYIGKFYQNNKHREGSDTVKRIVGNMQNALFGNAIAETLRRSGNELEPYTVANPDKVLDECKWIAPYALLMEVTGYTPWKLEERLKIRDAVKFRDPECKSFSLWTKMRKRKSPSRSNKQKKTASSINLSMAPSLLPIWQTLLTVFKRKTAGKL